MQALASERFQGLWSRFEVLLEISTTQGPFYNGHKFVLLVVKTDSKA